MESRFFGERGGIFGLLDAIDKHREAIEYELLMARYRIADIGSASLDWGEFKVLLSRWQKLPGNAVAASINGFEAPSFEQQVLAVISDQLAVANWQRARGKGGKPKPLKRWWQKGDSERFGSSPIPISKFASWWDSKKKR